MDNKQVPLSEISKRVKMNNKNQETSLLRRALLLPLRFFGAFLGIDKESISSYNKKTGHNIDIPHHSYGGHNSPAAFRQQHHFDPEKWVIKEMQAEAYHDLVDGKGDHDCDHDHDL